MTPEQRAAFIAAEAGLLAANEGLRVLRASLATSEPPAPVDPPVDPPAPMPVPVVTQEPFNISRVLLLESMHNTGAAYERRQGMQVIDGAGEIGARLWGLQSGGVRLDLPPGDYVLHVDGTPFATAQAVGKRVAFPVAAGALRPGWRKVVVSGQGLTSPTWFVHVGRQHVDTLIPAATGSYELYHHAKHSWALVPADSTPTAVALKPRVAVPFSDQVPVSKLYRRMLVPQISLWRTYRHGDIRTARGTQSYYFSDLILRYPTWPLLDGPRGVGTVNMPTHVHIGKATKTADPASGPVGALYVTDPWRLMRVGADGSVRTLLGYRHDVAPYWGDAVKTQPPLVGDWSRVTGPKGLWECWGFEFDPATLGLDMAAAPIEGRHPHSGNPTGYLADTRHNRVLKVVFDGRSHDTPAVITEHITNLADPWRVTIDPVRRWLLISERASHRVVAHDIETGAFVRVILQGADLAAIDSGRSARLRAGVTREQARNEPIVSPEGLSLRGDWLYVGSFPQQQVRRVNLETGAVETICDLVNDGNMRFVDVAVSDGTFGPAGTVFISNWSNAKFGHPLAWVPGKGWWPIEQWSSSVANGRAHSGRGPWEAGTYSSGVAVGGGRLIFGSADWGLYEMTLATDADPKPNAVLLAAAKAELDPLLYGPGGLSPWGLPIPRGKSAAVDHYLAINESDNMATPTDSSVTVPPSTPVVFGGRFDTSVFASVAETRAPGVNAATSTEDQTLIINLHGSGNDLSALTGTRILTATLSEAAAYLTDLTFLWHEQKAGTINGNVAFNVWPWDRQDPPNAGNIRQSYWMGWTHSPTSELRLWTERRLDAMMARYVADPRVHPTKRAITGGSMGGWGTLRYGIRRPHLFPSIYPDRPRWRYGETDGSFRIPSWTIAIVPNYTTAACPNLVAEDGGGSAAAHMDLIAYAADTDNEIPWIGWVTGRNDGYYPFQDHIDAVAALRAANRGFAFYWNDGDHSTGSQPAQITASYPYGTFEIGKGYPIFSNHSLDSDPAVDLVGGINIGLKFRSVVETASSWSCEVSHISSACTVDVRPYSKVYTGSTTAKTATITAANAWTALSFP